MNSAGQPRPDGGENIVLYILFIFWIKTNTNNKYKCIIWNQNEIADNKYHDDAMIEFWFQCLRYIRNIIDNIF